MRCRMLWGCACWLKHIFWKWVCRDAAPQWTGSFRLVTCLNNLPKISKNCFWQGVHYTEQWSKTWKRQDQQEQNQQLKPISHGQTIHSFHGTIAITAATGLGVSIQGSFLTHSNLVPMNFRRARSGMIWVWMWHLAIKLVVSCGVKFAVVGNCGLLAILNWLDYFDLINYD